MSSNGEDTHFVLRETVDIDNCTTIRQHTRSSLRTVAMRLANHKAIIEWLTFELKALFQGKMHQS